MQYLSKDRLYTHVQSGANAPWGGSLRTFGPWGEGAFGRQEGRYSELELHSIKTAFSLVDSLWVDMSLGTSQVNPSCFSLNGYEM